MYDLFYEEMYCMEWSYWWFMGCCFVVNYLVRWVKVELWNGEGCFKLRICEFGCGIGGNFVDWSDVYDVFGVELLFEVREFVR